MRYNEISEARRNPELNKHRDRGVRTVVQMLHNRRTDNVGISMTELPKLGINPKTEYSTPVGVYFYPAYYYIDEYGSVPFKEDAPYIQVFEFDYGKLLSTHDYTESDYDRDVNSLMANYPDAVSEIKQLYSQAEDEAKIKIPAGYIWYITYKLSTWLAYGEGHVPYMGTKGKALKHSIIWNTMLRQLGYDVVIDDGSGVIHGNEPTQGVILNPRIMRLIGTVNNRDDKREFGTLGSLVTEKNTVTFVNRVGLYASRDPEVFTLDYYHDSYNPSKVSGRIDFIFSRFLKLIQEDPDLLRNLSSNQFKSIAMAAPARLKPAIVKVGQEYGMF